MMAIRCCGVWMSLGVMATAFANPVRTDFAYGLEVQSNEAAAVYELALPIAVYQRTAFSDLRDLRVFNADGEVVPHAIRMQATPASTSDSAVTLPIFPLRGDIDEALQGLQITVSTAGENLAVRARATEKVSLPVVAYLIDVRAIQQPVTALDLTWPTDAPQFSALATIEASDDLRHWRSVISGAPLVHLQFNGQQLSERRIDLPQTQAKFLRLTWAIRKAPFELHSLQAHMQATRSLPAREVAQFTATPVANRNNEYTFDVQAHLPVREINLELPQVNTLVRAAVFSRAQPQDEWQRITSATFYRLLNGTQEIRNRALALGPLTARYWLVQVASNGGGVGNGMPVLTAMWEPQRLLFVARGRSPFLIAFGSNRIQPGEATFDALLSGENDRNAATDF
ncbi:MAG: DUF3999 domain-containing protein, partial [Candidatus Obscuribacterales bacterium]|nr:DUF3999 domain-containing protein [Steroidobacteraceae bacterium]